VLGRATFCEILGFVSFCQVLSVFLAFRPPLAEVESVECRGAASPPALRFVE